jgi:hypothetical protein
MKIFEKITFLIVGLFFLGIGIFLINLFLDKIKLFRQHKKQKIGKINPGDKVFISGYVDHNAKLYSPITQQKCAAWEICVYAARGKSRETLLHSSSNENITITDEIDSMSVIIALDTPFNIAGSRRVNSVLQISKKPSFRDNQTTFSKFRDQRTYDFLEEYNFEKVNYLGLRRQMTVIEKTLVTGDKIFVWGEVIMDGNQKVLKAKFASDSFIMQIVMMIVFLFMGLIFSVVGLGMCKQVVY